MTKEEAEKNLRSQLNMGSYTVEDASVFTEGYIAALYDAETITWEIQQYLLDTFGI